MAPTLGVTKFCSLEGQYICVYGVNPESLHTEKICYKKKGWCLLCSAVLPPTASKMYSLYMSYESTLSLCPATSIAAALWSLVDAISFTCAMFSGSEESSATGARVPVICHAVAQGHGRLAANMGAKSVFPSPVEL